MRRYILIAAALVMGACGGTTTLETTTTSSASGTGGGGSGGEGSAIPKECQDPSKWVDEAFTVTFESGNWIYADETALSACEQYLSAACAFDPLCTPSIGLQTAQLVCDTIDGNLHMAFSCVSIRDSEGENVQQAAFDNVLVGMNCFMEFVLALPGDDTCVSGTGGGGGAGGGG